VSTSIAVRFGMRLRRLRKNRGWTQVRTAEEFGIDRSYISDMECGKKNVCLVEAAQVTVRSVPEWRSQYLHLMMRRGRKIAKVAMARKLAVRLYWMMRQGWDYEQVKKFGSHARQPGNRTGLRADHRQGRALWLGQAGCELSGASAAGTRDKSVSPLRYFLHTWNGDGAGSHCRSFRHLSDKKICQTEECLAGGPLRERFRAGS
jgi:DNA-binding XRE family transcriptional regulator